MHKKESDDGKKVKMEQKFCVTHFRSRKKTGTGSDRNLRDGSQLSAKWVQNMKNLNFLSFKETRAYYNC